jgi:uncharacterized DUF497 family protein
MKYDWNPNKNNLLKKEHHISFEHIVFHIAQGDVWKTADHPDQVNYPGQRIYFVAVNDYIYVVPFVLQTDGIFLKTIIPNRKATKAYREETGKIK